MQGGVGEVPQTQLVDLQHADAGEEKSQEPKQGPLFARAQIELQENRQQQRRQDDRGKLVAFGHGNRESP